nr:MAG TPA: hypothetical protein [Caudoviricetes sp.]
MDILNRIGINNKTNKRSKFAEFYSLKKDIKSNSVSIENSVIANSINDLISYRMSPRGEASNGKGSFLSKAKNGATNIVNKILAFLKRVKDYIMKKFRQFKEFIFGKKADKVEKATKVATTIISEVIKKNGVVPTDMPNNAWEYMKKQRSDAKNNMRDSINKRHDDLNDYIKETFSKIFGDNIPKTVKVDSIDIPKILLDDNITDTMLDEDITGELSEVLQYITTLRYDELLKNGSLGELARNRGVEVDEFGKERLKDLSKTVGQAYAKVITEFNMKYLTFTKNTEVVSVSVSEKDKLKKVVEIIGELKDNITAIKKVFSEINIKLIKYYDDTMKKVESLKKELNGDADFNELYKNITDMNGILMQNNDKLLKEADQLLKAYAELIDKINIKIN